MRRPATDRFSELAGLSESLTQLFHDNEGACKEAKRIVTAKDQTPILTELSGSKLVIVPGSHLMPSAMVLKAIQATIAVRPDAIIFSGGRTIESIPQGQTEASILRGAFSRANFGKRLGVRILTEEAAMHTRANFENIAREFNRKVQKADHIILVVHHLHSNRAVMAARQAFCHTIGIIREADFKRKTVTTLYDSDCREHAVGHLPNIADTVAKMIVGKKPDHEGITHVRPTTHEHKILDKLYTQAQEYALRTLDVRRIA